MTQTCGLRDKSFENQQRLMRAARSINEPEINEPQAFHKTASRLRKSWARAHAALRHTENTSHAISFHVVAPCASTIGAIEFSASGMKSQRDEGATAGDGMISNRRVMCVLPDVAWAGMENSDCVNVK
jgi:hypothetical protein